MGVAAIHRADWVIPFAATLFVSGHADFPSR